MTATVRTISVELTRTERELLIRLLDRVASTRFSCTDGTYKSFDAETAFDLLDRLRRP